MNFGGATDRPIVQEIVEEIENRLQGRREVEISTKTDMDYLESKHPEEYRIVQDYLASLRETQV